MGQQKNAIREKCFAKMAETKQKALLGSTYKVGVVLQNSNRFNFAKVRSYFTDL